MNVSDPLQELLARRAYLAGQAASRQSEFHSALLLSSTSILGILVALHRTGESPLYIRLVYLVAVLAFVLGILLLALAMYSCSVQWRRLLRRLDDRIISPPSIPYHTDIAEPGDDNASKGLRISAYISLLIGLMLLSAYTVLSNLS